MTDLPNRPKPLLIALLLPLAATSVACGDGDPTDDEMEGIFDDDPIDDENELSEEDRQACEGYCMELSTCAGDGGIDMQLCMDECTGALKQCQEDEFEEAVDKLEGCTNADACDGVSECTWEVSTQCFFGL